MFIKWKSRYSLYLPFPLKVGFFLGLFTLVGLIHSCSKENQSSESKPIITMKDSQCLNHTDLIFSQYLVAKLSSQEVNEFWNCLTRSFQIFKDYTHGKEQGLYNAKELRNFLEIYFLGSIRVTDGLLHELMELKKLFLGGSVDYVTTSELDYSLHLFEGFRQLTLGLLPHLKVINGETSESNSNYSPEELEQSLQGLSQGLNQLAQLIESKGQFYRFENFQTLLEELSQFIRQEKKGNRFQWISKLIPVLSDLKNILVGSPQDRIQPQQWRRTARIIAETAGIWIRLEHFSSLKGWSVGVAQWEQAFRFMNQASKHLGEEIQHTDKSVNWSHLEELIKKINDLTLEYRGTASLKDLLKFMPLIGELKSHLVGGEKNSIVPAEWPLFCQRIAQLVQLGLRWKFLIAPFDWSQGRGLEQLNTIVHEGVGLLGESIRQHNPALIKLTDLNHIVELLGQLNLLPMGLTSESLIATLPPLLNRIFFPPNEERPVQIQNGFPSSEGLTLKHIRYLSQQWEGWLKSQYFANEFVAKGAFPPVTPNDETLEEMKRMLDAPWPQVSDVWGRLLFQSVGELSWNQKGVTQINWARALLRLLVIGYAQDNDRQNLVYGLTQEELHQVSDDLFPLAVAMGLFSPDDTQIWKRIFIESDLFMPRSNGDSLINLVEGMEYLSFVLSGINAGIQVVKSLPSSCINNGNAQKERVDTLCYRSQLIQERVTLLGHLPHLLRATQLFTSDQWTSFLESMEKTVRGEEGSDTKIPIKTADLKELLILSQYLETFFLRFNLDGDRDHINIQESLNAFSIYDQFLKNLLQLEDKSDREVIFTFMFKKCQIPDLNDPHLLEELQQWSDTRSDWQVDSDRQCLINILSSLVKMLSSDSVKSFGLNFANSSPIR